MNLKELSPYYVKQRFYVKYDYCNTPFRLHRCLVSMCRMKHQIKLIGIILEQTSLLL